MIQPLLLAFGLRRYLLWWRGYAMERQRRCVFQRALQVVHRAHYPWLSAWGVRAVAAADAFSAGRVVGWGRFRGCDSILFCGFLLLEWRRIAGNLRYQRLRQVQR